MRHGVPDRWTPIDLVAHAQSVGTQISGGAYVPARPLGWQGWMLGKRLRLAWAVFCGRFDALDWGEGQR